MEGGIKCSKCHFDNLSDSKFCKECGTQIIPSEEISISHTKTLETPKEEFTRGTTFANRYEFMEKLGAGGMGKVYKVFDKKIKEEVALKILKSEIASDEKTIERFSNELKLARKIRHENVCQMYDINEEEGTHYITMEYVPGEDLKSFVRRVGQLPAGKSISIAKQISEGLVEAHRLGVVHRDLKPQNIMIDKEGNARIMDFGIALSLKTRGITGTGVMIGTPEYMSPEQVEGKEIDQRSDIYSLGIILYEMLTGTIPFEGETPFSIALKHKSEIPKDPKELNAQIPEDLSRVILRSMEKDREERYQTAGELLSELTNIEEGIPTTERVVPKRKPITAREITVTFGLRKLFIPAIVVVAIAIIVLVIWQPWLQKEAVPVPSDKPSLAIMYFQNNTGDKSLDIWRDGLSRMLISDISQSMYIRVLPDDQIYGILNKLNLLEAKNYSTEDLREVATRGGSTHILKGILTRSGDSFRINTTLQESSTMEIVDSEMVEGKGEGSLHTMVDELTRKIKESFKLSEEEIASDIDSEAGKITTSYPEAYKYYIEGRKYFAKGDFHQSIQLMEKALAIDPEFAMAYRSIAVSYGNLGYGSKGRKFRQKALELSDRVSIREQYIIKAQAEKSQENRIEIYRKLLELYPENGIGNVNLGLIYYSLEEWDKAIERYEVVIQNKTESYIPYENISWAYWAKGSYEKAREILEYYLDNISDNAYIHRNLAKTYIYQAKFDLALIEVDKAFYLDPTNPRNSRLRGDLYLYRGDMIKTEEENKKLLKSRDPESLSRGLRGSVNLYILQGRFEVNKSLVKQGLALAKQIGEKGGELLARAYLANIFLSSGNPEKALKECDQALSIAFELGQLDYPKYLMWLKGMAYLDMKSIDDAQKTAEELKEMTERGMNKKLKRYNNLMGRIELEKENFPKAIDYFKEAISLLPYQYTGGDEHALFIEPLALAYYNAGDLEKAQKEYEWITHLTTGRLAYGDIYAKSFFMLGKIYEKKSKKRKAIEFYEKFLHLWKNADPGFPEVEDSRKTLAELKSQ